MMRNEVQDWPQSGQNDKLFAHEQRNLNAPDKHLARSINLNVILSTLEPFLFRLTTRQRGLLLCLVCLT